jgi:hypothetical protein
LILDYRGKWLRGYTGGWDGTEETRDYFERVVVGVRKAYEGKAKPVLMVPAGDVVLEPDGRTHRDVHKFYLSANGVWLTVPEPPSYLTGA